MDFHHFSDTFSPFFTSSPWAITSQRAKQQHILFFSKGQRMKKDVDINVTRVLWYIFNVWEKIETQGENKQACMDHCVWGSWYLQIHLSKSCKCFHVFFYDNDGEWVMSWDKPPQFVVNDSTTLQMSWRMKGMLFAKEGEASAGALGLWEQRGQQQFTWQIL